ncbi:hypothetical protein H0H87_007217 [Tephrocybe sp. NHM501043]|nr:hypothetical protein H0H87_007217 [Tephrocybe sp. NHM501043]
MTSRCEISKKVKTFDIPISDLQLQHPNKRLVVGVAIFSLQASSSPQLLLLQRSETEDSFPSMYEIPGGGSEPEDRTLLDTVIREVKEETGLVVSKIVDTFEGFEYTTRSGDAVQFNFVVEIEGETTPLVAMNSEEHQAYSWVDPGDDLATFKLTDDMLKVVQDALQAGLSLF